MPGYSFVLGRTSTEQGTEIRRALSWGAEGCHSHITAIPSLQYATEASKNISQTHASLHLVFWLQRAVPGFRSIPHSNQPAIFLELIHIAVDSTMCTAAIELKYDLTKQLGTALQGEVKPSEFQREESPLFFIAKGLTGKSSFSDHPMLYTRALYARTVYAARCRPGEGI